MTWLWLALMSLGGVAWWHLDVRWLRPWKRCPRCGGSGKGMGSNSRLWGYCGRCHGDKMVRRFGAPKQ